MATCATCNGAGELGSLDKDQLPVRCPDCNGCGEFLEECADCGLMFQPRDLDPELGLCMPCWDRWSRRENET